MADRGGPARVETGIREVPSIEWWPGSGSAVLRRHDGQTISVSHKELGRLREALREVERMAKASRES